MKAKDLIILGGAVALFYLYQRNKNKKSSISTIVENEDVTPEGSGELNGGTTTGGGAVFTGGGTTTGGTTTAPAGTSQVVTLPTTPPIVKPVKGNVDAVLDLPTNMDLPVLTPATGVPTEVAIQQGGVKTTPEITPVVTIPSTGGGYIEPITGGGDSDVIGTIKAPIKTTRVLTQNTEF